MTEPRVTNEQLDLMRHTVGIQSNSDKPYRNYFATHEGCIDYDALNDLVSMGLMTKRDSPVNDDMILFHMTDAGCHMLNMSGLDAIA